MKNTVIKLLPLFTAAVIGGFVARLIPISEPNLQQGSSVTTPKLKVTLPTLQSSSRLSYKRCTGVEGDEKSGTISVYEWQMDGCLVRWRQAWNKKPTCEVTLVGDLEGYTLAKKQLIHFDYEDGMDLPEVKSRMVIKYQCH